LQGKRRFEIFPRMGSVGRSLLRNCAQVRQGDTNGR
jgi:hypothetical protein